jgi:prepilin-type processing-associated H-X9-DG protein
MNARIAVTTLLAMALAWGAPAASALSGSQTRPQPKAPPRLAAPASRLEVQIHDPALTGLVPGRYGISVVMFPPNLTGSRRPTSAEAARIPVKLFPLPGTPRPAPGSSHPGAFNVVFADGSVHFMARPTGCAGKLPADWTASSPRVVKRPDGSLQIELASRAVPGCRLVGVVPAARADSKEDKKAATSLGYNIVGSTEPWVLSPKPPRPLEAPHADETDHLLMLTVARAGSLWSRLRCLPSGRSDVEELACGLKGAMATLARAHQPAAAVAPLQDLEAKVQALTAAAEKEAATTRNARLCVANQRRCVAGGGFHGHCSVDEAACLNYVVFPAP